MKQRRWAFVEAQAKFGSARHVKNARLCVARLRVDVDAVLLDPGRDESSLVRAAPSRCQQYLSQIIRTSEPCPQHRKTSLVRLTTRLLPSK